jgi:very-short-patch-repair endonuclease
MRLKSAYRLRNRVIHKKFGIRVSMSETKFLDILEVLYNVKIERQFKLNHRYYDGRYGEYLIEVDGEKWHSKPKDQLRDKLKDKIAAKNGFKLCRIVLNSSRDIPKVLLHNSELLKELFSGHK